MTVEQSLISFVAAACILTITPGVDTALVLRTATVDSAKSAIGASLGILVGLLIWGSAVALGLGGLLAASEMAYTILKWIGAAYLLYLGAKLLLKPRKEFAPTAESAADKRGGMGQGFAKGLFTNLLNPKVGVFYATFLPQFVPANVPVTGWTFLLAVLHIILTIFWFAALIGASVPLGRFLRRPRILQALDRLTGVIFVAFGIRLLQSKNS